MTGVSSGPILPAEGWAIREETGLPKDPAPGMATVLTLQPDTPPTVFDEAARVISRGGVLAIPTESSYGLGASATDEAAIRRVCALKGRPDGKPILVLIGDPVHLTGLIEGITPAAEALINRCWPGPLTLIMRASPLVSPLLTGGTGTIGVRRPGHPALLRLLLHVGPLTGTSANRSGDTPCCRAYDVQKIFGSEVDLILDGGPTSGGMPSTVVNTVGRVYLIRAGAFPQQQVEAALAAVGLALET